MSQPMLRGNSQINWDIPIGIVYFCPPKHMNKFFKVNIVSHIFAYQYIEIKIGSVLLKSMYHYKDIHSKITFLHLQGSTCNTIEYSSFTVILNHSLSISNRKPLVLIFGMYKTICTKT